MNAIANILRHQIRIELQKTEDRSVTALLDLIVRDALVRRASDLHIDPLPEKSLVRLRIDGDLSDSYTVPYQVHSEIISRLKVLAGLRTDQHFTAHDGKLLFFSHSPDELPVRVSIVPTQYGENAVLRLHRRTTKRSTFFELGMSAVQEKCVIDALSHTHGLIIVSGATGSGKTTTLYSLMEYLSERSLSLTSIEDPIESVLRNTTQVQVHQDFSFADGLRALLRQDPDVLMIGEIRDSETATLALQAAITGHLVLATLHSNSLRIIPTRLSSLGADQHLYSTSLRLAICQRLVRKACKHCIRKRELSGEERASLTTYLGESIDPPTHGYHAEGCIECVQKGYRGRIGIFDMTSHPFSTPEDLTLSQNLCMNIEEGIITYEEGLTFLRSQSQSNLTYA